MNLSKTRLLVVLGLSACVEPGGKNPDGEDTGSGVECAPGMVEDEGICVPERCGVGPWGALPVDDTTVYVDASSTGEELGTAQAPFHTIQGAIEQAGGGDIAIAAGSYPELLSLGETADGLRIAGRCSELVRVGGAAESAPGRGVVGVDAGEASIEISGITVEGAISVGIRLVSGDLKLEEVTVQQGGGEGVLVTRGVSHTSTLLMEGSVLSGNGSAGVSASGAGTTVTILASTVEDSRPDASGRGGFGVQAFEGATLRLESCLVKGNSNEGVIADGEGTNLTLQDVEILDTLPREDGHYGYGVEIFEDVSLVMDRCTVRGNTEVGVFAHGSGASATIRESTIEGTHSNANGGKGYGIVGESGASIWVTSSVLRDNTEVGLVVNGLGTTVRFEDSSIEDTRVNAHELGGHGVEVSGQGSLEMVDSTILRAIEVGLMAYEEGSSVHTLRTTIGDTQGTPRGPLGVGYGVSITDKATLEMHSSVVEGSRVVGISVAGRSSSILLFDSTIRDTQADAGGNGGFGVQVVEGGTLEATRSLITGSALIGLATSEAGSSVVLDDCVIEDTLEQWEVGGYGIQVVNGAHLDADSCALLGNHAVGLAVGTVNGRVPKVNLLNSRINGTRRGGHLCDGLGMSVDGPAEVTAQGLELSSNDGAGLRVSGPEAWMSCVDCVIADNHFAGAVVVDGGSLELYASSLEDNLPDPNLGGGMGLFAANQDEGRPTLLMDACTVAGNPIAGVWLSGEGSYRITASQIEGGSGSNLGEYGICGDAIFARQGIDAWDGKSGLYLGANTIELGRGAGLFLVDAAATLGGNTWMDNEADLWQQGEGCELPPEGVEDEPIERWESCPAYNRATCDEEFHLQVNLAIPGE